ncbi:MAG: hypothetical protein BRC58_01185 [Cyanobacteria bacterium QS_8_64_29]|nr:MAG: hypothetical protein BRC58_01185 [Cyanobacteria bacterium QS_8_64_29]
MPQARALSLGIATAGTTVSAYRLRQPAATALHLGFAIGWAIALLQAWLSGSDWFVLVAAIAALLWVCNADAGTGQSR